MTQHLERIGHMYRDMETYDDNDEPEIRRAGIGRLSDILDGKSHAMKSEAWRDLPVKEQKTRKGDSIFQVVLYSENKENVSTRSTIYLEKILTKRCEIRNQTRFHLRVPRLCC